MILTHECETNQIEQSCVHDYSHYFLNYGNDQTSHVVHDCAHDKNSRNNENSHMHNFVLYDVFYIYV